jgi:phage regulator Rha-like protein
MNTDIIKQKSPEGGEQRMTSLEIAEVTGKLHKNVMRDIRNMEPAWEKEHGLKFELMQIREELPNGGYRLRPAFSLTKLESLYVATKFNDEARARLVIRWAELEKGLRTASQPESQKLLVTEQEIVHRSNLIMQKKIENENRDNDGCFTTSEIAKEMDMTVKQLNKLLVDTGIQYFNGGRYKLTPQYEGKGFSRDRKFHYYSLDGEKKERFYLVWTPEGKDYILNNI